MAASIYDVQSLLTYIICSLAFANNLLLFTVYFCCPLKNRSSYRYFFISAAVQDMVFSVLLMLVVPKVISHDSLFIFVSTGWVDRLPLGDAALLLYCMSFFSTLLLVTNGFLYRYLQLCRWNIFLRYSSKRNTIIAVFINLALLFNILVAIYISVWPTDHLRELVQTSISIPDFDIGGASFVGFSLKYSVTPMRLAFLFDVLLLTSMLLWIDILCARGINAQLRSTAYSKKSRNLQRQMFILLILQAAGPIIFLQIPCAVAVFYLFTGNSTTTLITVAIGVLLTFYPFSNPLLILAFVKDYRVYILTKLKIRNTKLSKTAPPNIAYATPQVCTSKTVTVAKQVSENEILPTKIPQMFTT